eukprot:GDKI01003236.1.p1 GENE.GDKI01003236.1~~GDKI01003236.1.p1  ORF type:complete len:303 (-),score=109.01 GDKI01003236.1:643-1551(-)
MKVSAGVVALAAVLSSAHGYDYYRTDLLKFFNQLPNNCRALGHTSCSRGSESNTNAFGRAFDQDGWTTATCNADSDNDGKTNGDEMGDPCCTLVKGGPLQRADGLSHPGLSSSTTTYKSCYLEAPAATAGDAFISGYAYGDKNVQLTLAWPDQTASCFCSYELKLDVTTSTGTKSYTFTSAAVRSVKTLTFPAAGSEMSFVGATKIEITPNYINGNKPGGVSGSKLTITLDRSANGANNYDTAVDGVAASTATTVTTGTTDTTDTTGNTQSQGSSTSGGASGAASASGMAAVVVGAAAALMM